ITRARTHVAAGRPRTEIGDDVGVGRPRLGGRYIFSHIDDTVPDVLALSAGATELSGRERTQRGIEVSGDPFSSRRGLTVVQPQVPCGTTLNVVVGDHHECLESVGSKPSSVAFGRQDLPPRTILHTELVWSTEAVQEQAERVVAANVG